MKKSFIIISSITGLLIFSGCTQQVASANPKNANGATMVASDTVTLDSSGGGASSSGGAYGKGKNSVHFAYDSNKLSQKEKRKISQDSGTLKSKSVIKVEGNSDEFGTDEYNYALGLRRAKAVKDTMVAKGVPAKKIKLVSYGESNPECTDKTQECYQQNRRADYK
ncbi:MAG: OmpA family protein [Sulfurovum sp.]|nr:OmpA family protein [Sulfurovum sp.]